MEPFITAEELAGYVRRDLSAIPLVDLYLDAACQAVRDYLHQELNFQRNDETFIDGTGTDALLLPELPVLGVGEVLQFTAVGTDYEVLAEDDDYRVGAGGILWRLGHVWTPGHANVFVRYSHGYLIGSGGSGDVDTAEDPFIGDEIDGGGPSEFTDSSGSGSGSGTAARSRVPADIRLVALACGKRALEAGVVAGGGIQQETMGKYSYQLSPTAEAAAGDLSDGEKRVLDAYRERRAA